MFPEFSCVICSGNRTGRHLPFESDAHSVSGDRATRPHSATRLTRRCPWTPTAVRQGLSPSSLTRRQVQNIAFPRTSGTHASANEPSPTTTPLSLSLPTCRPTTSRTPPPRGSVRHLRRGQGRRQHASSCTAARTSFAGGAMTRRGTRQCTVPQPVAACGPSVKRVFC